MFPALQKQFHSITKSLDVLYVLEGAKPCSRIMAHEDELSGILNFFKENKISAVSSDFKVLKQNAQSRSYSDKSIKITKDHPGKGHFFVYMSKGSPETAKKAEAENDHMKLGLELGYPECCCG